MSTRGCRPTPPPGSGEEDLCREAVHTCRYDHPWLQVVTLPPGSEDEECCRDVVNTCRNGHPWLQVVTPPPGSGEEVCCRDAVNTCRYGHPWLQADTSTRLVISQSQTRPHVNKLKVTVCER